MTSPQFHDDQDFPESDKDAARDAVLELLNNWVESGGSPAALLNAMHETLCDVVAECGLPMQ